MQPIHYNYLVFKNITIKGSLLSDTTLAQEMVNLVAEKGMCLQLIAARHSILMSIFQASKSRLRLIR